MPSNGWITHRRQNWSNLAWRALVTNMLVTVFLQACAVPCAGVCKICSLHRWGLANSRMQANPQTCSLVKATSGPPNLIGSWSKCPGVLRDVQSQGFAMQERQNERQSYLRNHPWRKTIRRYLARGSLQLSKGFAFKESQRKKRKTMINNLRQIWKVGLGERFAKKRACKSISKIEVSFISKIEVSI